MSQTSFISYQSSLNWLCVKLSQPLVLLCPMYSVYSNRKTSSLWHTPVTKWSVRYNCLYTVGLCNDKHVNLPHVSGPPKSQSAISHPVIQGMRLHCTELLCYQLVTSEALLLYFSFNHHSRSLALFKIKVNGDYWEFSMLGFCLMRGPFYSFTASDFTASTMKLSSLHSVSCL